MKPIAIVIAALSLCLAAPAAAGEAKRPEVIITSVNVSRGAVTDTTAGSAKIVVDACAAIGPRSVFTVTETRTLGKRRVARAVSRDPLGVDLDSVEPRDCFTGYTIAWTVAKKLLVGAGTYTVSVRVTDGYGHQSPAAVFSLRL